MAPGSILCQCDVYSSTLLLPVLGFILSKYRLSNRFTDLVNVCQCSDQSVVDLFYHQLFPHFPSCCTTDVDYLDITGLSQYYRYDNSIGRMLFLCFNFLCCWLSLLCYSWYTCTLCMFMSRPWSRITTSIRRFHGIQESSRFHLVSSWWVSSDIVRVKNRWWRVWCRDAQRVLHNNEGSEIFKFW